MPKTAYLTLFVHMTDTIFVVTGIPSKTPAPHPRVEVLEPSLASGMNTRSLISA